MNEASNEIEIELLTKDERLQLMLTLHDALGSGELNPQEMMIIRYEASLRVVEGHLIHVAQLTHSSAQVVQVAARNIMQGTEKFIAGSKQGGTETNLASSVDNLNPVDDDDNHDRPTED